MLDRRQFLTYLGTLATAGTLAGCGAGGAGTLHLQVLEKSLPPQAIGRFRRQGGKVKVALLPQIATARMALEELAADEPSERSWRDWLPGNWGAIVPDLVTLGDTWLPGAIADNLLQPFTAEEWTVPLEWPRRDRWRQVLQQDGKTWGVPYRWGTAVLAYRQDKLPWRPTHWEDLWRPDLHERFSLPDAPRLVLGLTLKTLGASANEPDPESVAGLRDKLARLQQKAKYYSSRNYLQPLVLGDTWAAIGWSADILALSRQYPDIRAIVPQEGSALWADLWVRPRQATPALPPVARDWLEFCNLPETGRLVTRFARGTTPAALPRIDIPELTAPDEALDRSEFLLPLPEAARDRYAALWLAMRQNKL